MTILHKTFSSFFFSSLLFLIASFLFSCSGKKEVKDSIPQSVIGGYEPMLNVLNKAIEEDPDDAELVFKRASLYYNMFFWNDALKDVQQSISLDDKQASYYLLLAKIQYQRRKYVDAIKASEKCQALGSNDVELPVLQANLYFHIGDTSRMQSNMQKSDQLVPFHTDLALLRAKIAQKSGDTTTSMVYFKKAIATYPRNLEALKGLMNIYNNRAQDDSLMFYLMGVRALANRDSELWYWEGCFYKRKGMPESALRCFNTALEIDSTYFPTYLSKANLYFRVGKMEEARKQYLNYTRFEKENKFVYQQLIAITTEMEGEQATIPYYEKLTELDTNNVNAKFVLSKLYKTYNIQQPVVNKPTVVPPPAKRDTTKSTP